MGAPDGKRLLSHVALFQQCPPAATTKPDPRLATHAVGSCAAHGPASVRLVRLVDGTLRPGQDEGREPLVGSLLANAQRLSHGSLARTAKLVAVPSPGAVEVSATIDFAPAITATSEMAIPTRRIRFSSSAFLTGILTLSGDGVFIFKAGSAVITAPNASVVHQRCPGLQRFLGGRQLGNA